MKKSYTIDAFFKRKNVENLKPNEESHFSIDFNPLNSESCPTKFARVEIKTRFDINLLERDLRLRLQIWGYPINNHDKVQKVYIKVGPYQCIHSPIEDFRDLKEWQCVFWLIMNDMVF